MENKKETPTDEIVYAVTKIINETSDGERTVTNTVPLNEALAQIGYKGNNYTECAVVIKPDKSCVLEALN